MKLQLGLVAVASLACAPEPGGGSTSSSSGGVSDAGPVDAGQELDTLWRLPGNVRAVFQALDQAAECPELIWAGHDFTDEQILLLDKDAGRAWIWRDPSVADDSRLEPPIPAGELPVGLRSFDYFTVEEWEGVLTLGVDLVTAEMLDEDAEAAGILQAVPYAASLAFHEGFHFLGGQDDFSTNLAFERDPRWPLLARPRFLRTELLGALRQALLDSDDDALRRARAWQDKLVAEFPDELTALEFLDVYEGSAQYVETMSASVAYAGCNAESAVMTARVYAEGMFPDFGLSRSGESYLLGALAGMLLRDQGTSGLENRARAEPLLDILLDDITPLPVDEADPAVTARRTAVEQAVQQENDAAGQTISPALDAWNSAGNARLLIPSSYVVGAFSYAGGYLVDDGGQELHLMLRLSLDFLSPDDQGSGTLDDVTAVETNDSPCGAHGYVVPVAAAQLPLEGRASVEVSGVALEDVALEHLSAGNVSWACVH